MSAKSELAVAYIALGSNLENPELQVSQAMNDLGTLDQTQLVAKSSLYRSAPVGYADQPDFVNAVAKMATRLSPKKLLEALLLAEQQRGRVRTFQNAPRTLDLDILLYNDLIIHEDGLTIPHPHMHQRAFVLAPLFEIAPDALIPGRGRVADLLAACETQHLKKID